MRHYQQLSWPLLPLPNQKGRLRFPAGLDASVQDNIRIILSTRPGELMFHSDFGAGLDELLHEPNSLELRREIHDRIAESLGRWEPRISVERVDVDEVEGAPAKIRVRIGYSLRRTGTPANLGLTLEAGR